MVSIVVIGALVIYLAGADQSSSSAQALGNLGIFAALSFASLACIRAARAPSPARRAWAVLAVAPGLSGLSQFYYAVSILTGAEATPSPAVDVVGLVGYIVPVLVALFWFPRRSQYRISRYRMILDALVITTGLVVMSQATVLHDVYRNTDLGTVTGWVRMAYPVVDITLCSVVLTLGMRQASAQRLMWLALGGGLVLLAVTDSVYVMLLARGQYDVAELTGSPLAGGWMAAAVLIVLSTLVPTGRRARRPRDVAVLTQLLPYGPVLGAYLILLFESARDETLLLIGEAFLLVLVIARQVMIVYENVNLTRDLEEKVAARTAELAAVGSIVSSSSDAIVGLSVDNTVTTWNPAAEKLWGYPAAEVLGRIPHQLAPEELEAMSELARSASATGTSKLGDYEMDWTRPDGTIIPVALTISSILDTGGVQGMSVFAQDITERRRAEAALEAAREEALTSSRLKSEFLATMSHEIRTPMNGVIGLTSLLLLTEQDDVQRQYADGVKAAGESLLSLLNDLLDFSKLEAGKVVLDRADFDLTQLIDELGVLLAPAAFAKHLELIASCAPGVPQVVHGDSGRIRQIVLNLASNAVKFTARGEVAVQVTVADGADEGPAEEGAVRLRFTVTDTGIGVAEADQERLFESFSQADTSTTRRFGGTGLGLAISRRLVEAMDGQIGLQSEPGVGSAFWFEISVALGAAPLSSAEPPRLDVLAGRRVLVVDDNATNRTILAAQLTSWEMQADLIEDALTALGRLRAAASRGEGYDVAVLDMMMPDVDGVHLASMISADPVLTGLPVIMLTSAYRPEADTLRAAGIGQWLSKPVRSSDLHDKLARLMTTQQPAVEPPGRSELGGPAGSANGRGRILVVEDNTLNQLVAEGILFQLGYQVHSVANGAEALQAIEAMSYAAILMDCHMPVMDGFTATGEIRRGESPGERIPIIAMTAAAMSEDRRRCIEAGMDDYVSKPIGVATLEVVLGRWIEHADEPARRSPTSPARAEPPLDHSRLTDLAELPASDGSSLLSSIVTAFTGRSSERLRALRRAVRTGDVAELEAAAHELKGASGTIGAGRVAALCRELELSAQEGAAALRPGLLDELEMELAVAADELERFVSVRT